MPSWLKIFKENAELECPICFKKFGKRPDIILHLREHAHETQNRCPFPGCKGKFIRGEKVQQMTLHYMLKHPKDGKQCNQCYRCFKNTSALDEHLSNSKCKPELLENSGEYPFATNEKDTIPKSVETKSSETAPNTSKVRSVSYPFPSNDSNYNSHKKGDNSFGASNDAYDYQNKYGFSSSPNNQKKFGYSSGPSNNSYHDNYKRDSYSSHPSSNSNHNYQQKVHYLSGTSHGSYSDYQKKEEYLSGQSKNYWKKEEYSSGPSNNYQKKFGYSSGPSREHHLGYQKRDDYSSGSPNQRSYSNQFSKGNNYNAQTINQKIDQMWTENVKNSQKQYSPEFSNFQNPDDNQYGNKIPNHSRDKGSKYNPYSRGSPGCSGHF